MTSDDTTASQDIPKPDVALRRLSRLVGTWKIEGHPIDSDASITGTTTFKWLHKNTDDSTGFFLQQDMDMDYDGMPIKSHELIGYNSKTKAFSSYVYSNMAAEPWPYEWDIQNDKVTISIKFGPMDATFTGTFSPDGKTWSGGWRPSAGADKEINAPYDIVATRVES